MQIVYQNGRFAAWPSLARGKDRLVLVCSGDRQHHIDPFGKTVLLVSRDQGVTWDDPLILKSSPLDERDPGILQTRAGTWVLSFFCSTAFIGWQEKARKIYGDDVVDTWMPVIKKVTHGMEAKYLGGFIRRSEDNCRSFGPMIPSQVFTPHGPIELTDGRLMMVGSDKRGMIACSVSLNDGIDWSMLSTICAYDHYSAVDLCEPHLLELPTGGLLCMLRANAEKPSDRLLYKTLSYDGGRSWSLPQPTSVWGVPPHLLLHSSGVILVTFGHRRPPYAIQAALSDDRGKTWSFPRTLMEFVGGQAVLDVGPDNLPSKKIYYQEPDIGYPASVELDDGSIFTAFYGPVGSGKTGIMAVRWCM